MTLHDIQHDPAVVILHPSTYGAPLVFYTAEERRTAEDTLRRLIYSPRAYHRLRGLYGETIYISGEQVRDSSIIISTMGAMFGADWRERFEQQSTASDPGFFDSGSLFSKGFGFGDLEPEGEA